MTPKAVACHLSSLLAAFAALTAIRPLFASALSLARAVNTYALTTGRQSPEEVRLCWVRLPGASGQGRRQS